MSSHRGQRALRAREPKIVENAKKCMLLRGIKTSEVVVEAMRDLHRMKLPDARMMQRKNPIVPFDDASSLEFMAEKNDCSLFVLGNHNKKRPHNLIFGRMFDHRVLDMIELGIVDYVPMAAFPTEKGYIGTKPCMAFIGDEFSTSPEMALVKDYMLDFFRGQEVADVALSSLDRAIVVTAEAGVIHLRVYRIQLKKSGTKHPRVELIPIGPFFDFQLRRTQFASMSVRKEALRRPKQARPTKLKNVERTTMGDKVGRIHMERQDLSKMALHHSKALRGPKRKKAGAGEDSGSEAGGAPSAAAEGARKRRRREEGQD